MARLELGRIVAGGLLLAGLQLLLMGPASGAERSVRVDTYTVATPTLLLSSATIAFGSIPIGSSVDSTNATGGSDTTTNTSITLTNNSGINGPSGRIGTLTLDYTDTTPGANCGVGEGDWVPDSTDNEANIGTDEFVMYGDLASDLLTKIVIPADGNPSANLPVGNWNNGSTRILDLQLFMPLAVTTGTSQCSIALTITSVVP